jgi:hypothetical protein
MGGSSGRGSEEPPRISLEELIKRSQQNTSEAQYRRDVEELLDGILHEYNDRDTETITKHLEIIKEAIAGELEDDLKLLFGGSTQKHTYANGISDIDMLVCINKSDLAKKSPLEIMEYFSERLKERMPRTKIRVGDMAITVSFSDGHEIQLLPAIQSGNGFKIKDPNENRWSNVISPRRFAQKLTTVNQKVGGNVVPIIKIFKGINEKLPRAARLTGYHIESLAIEAFDNYQGDITHREMLRHFVSCAVKHVLTPIKDSTGQSRHVDDYMGSAHSDYRLRTSHVLQNLLQRIQRANAANSIDMWQQIIEG